VLEPAAEVRHCTPPRRSLGSHDLELARLRRERGTGARLHACAAEDGQEAALREMATEHGFQVYPLYPPWTFKTSTPVDVVFGP
jgi:hypothetical protein